MIRLARAHPACRAEARLWSAAACCRFPPGQLAGRQRLPTPSTAARASSLKESGSKLPHSRAPAVHFIRLACYHTGSLGGERPGVRGSDKIGLSTAKRTGTLGCHGLLRTTLFSARMNAEESEENP